MVGHAIASLQHSHHLRGIHVQAEEVRPRDDHRTREELTEKDRNDHQEVGDEQRVVGGTCRPITNQRREGDYHAEYREGEGDVVEQRVVEIEGVKGIFLDDEQR